MISHRVLLSTSNEVELFRSVNVFCDIVTCKEGWELSLEFQNESEKRERKRDRRG